MDLQMPEMDGLEATRQIRNPDSLVKDHNIPVVAMTANAMQGDRKKCIDAGMNDYLTKPVNPKELAAAIDKWVLKNNAAKNGKQSIEPESNTSGRTAVEEPEWQAAVFNRECTLKRMLGAEDLIRIVLKEFLKEYSCANHPIKKCHGQRRYRPCTTNTHIT